MNEPKSIHIKGARVHNLRNIEVEIPHDTLTVITGLSGSGKSTLAFDTIFAEGQRRYVESLSAYARQFLGKIDKPDVDLITGIAPAIAIEQKVNTRNPRSTVGTTTEIYDYLKLLFARIGRTFSPVSGREVKCYDVDDVAQYVLALGQGAKALVAAPLVAAEGQGVIEKLTLLMGDGIQRVQYDGRTRFIEELLPELDPAVRPDELSVIVDRLRVASDEEFATRLRDSVARAFAYGDGVCRILTDERAEEFSSRFEADGIAFEQPTEHLFSFNNPLGACPRCEGYGKIIGIDEDLVIPDKSKTIYEGAIACWRGETMRLWKEKLVENAGKFDFPIHTPYHELTPEQKRLLWTGNEYFYGLDSFFEYIDSERRKIQFRVMKARYTGKTRCPECGGSRLRKEALYVRVSDCTIADLVTMNVDALLVFFKELQLDAHDTTTARRILTEIVNRLQYLADVGLGYLTLDRLSSTLSGGESQRINLATSLGSNLVGSLYILDEPSIGLHPRDTNRLVGVLKQLRDIGNTVIVVEHEEEVIRAADWIVDVGPEAGYNGGEIVFCGPAKKLPACRKSLTADYLAGRRRIEPPSTPRGWSHSIVVKGARENNLQNIDVRFPLGAMTCVTGVSGSGKSSLVKGILYPALRRMLFDTGIKPGDFDALEGDVQLLKSVEMVDQNPIGKSTRSNPVTYIKAYDEIRKLFADQPYAQHNGMTPSHFSFNIAGGRCEECQGEGVIKVSMQFMADIELKCEACGGRRFKEEVLEVKYRGRSIYDVLEMTVDDAVAFFGEDKANAVCRRIVDRLLPLQEVGLGYIKLGQSSSTLSGGESQRVKLASFLAKDAVQGNVLFLFDEPTTGLHFHDINKLLAAFDALIRKGHTIVVVEHNMDVIKCADWVIDLRSGRPGRQGSLRGDARPARNVCGELHGTIPETPHQTVKSMKEFHTYTLPNGIRGIHRQVRGNVAHCALVVGAGTRDELKSEYGLAHFAEHAFFKGTQRRRAYQVNCRLENLGGELNAYTTKEDTTLHATVLRGDFAKAVELLADVAFRSTFPERELEREREVIFDEINTYKDSPADRIYDDFEDLLFAGSALGHNILGTKAALARYRSEHIHAFVRRTHTTDQMVFSSIGNIAPRRIEAIAARYFADMPATVRSFCRTAPAPVAPFERSIARHTHQSHCIVGARAYGILDPKRLPLALLVNILGGPSANSMLNVTVREKHGLSYSIEGSYTPYGDAGIVAIYFSSDHDNCDRCLELVRGQIDSLRTRRLSTRRLALAKKQFVAQLAISMESNEGYMLGAGKSYLVHSEVDTMEEVYRKISDLQAGELLEVANEVLASPSLLVYR